MIRSFADFPLLGLLFADCNKELSFNFVFIGGMAAACDTALQATMIADAFDYPCDQSRSVPKLIRNPSQIHRCLISTSKYNYIIPKM